MAARGPDEGLYDHEDRGDVADGARRRGPVADWGGDELFDRRPVRRSRPGATAPTASRTPGHGVSPHATAAPQQEHQRSQAASPGHGRPATAGRGWAPVELRDLPTERAPEVRIEEAPPAAGEPTGAQRRTIVISGRPAGTRSRRRSGVPDHLGTRPDHTAAWAVGLGLVLILVAILTAGI